MANLLSYSLVPGLNLEEGLAFAMQDADPYLEEVSLAVLRLRRSGFLESLYNKWWHGTDACPEEKKTSKFFFPKKSEKVGFFSTKSEELRQTCFTSWNNKVSIDLFSMVSVLIG